MTIKLFEIRDAATFIPAMAIRVSGDDGYLMRRAGFGSPMIYLVHLTSEKCKYDPFGWDNRTMHTAHLWIEKNFQDLKSGQVVDVQFILGESVVPKESEEVTFGR